MCHYVCLCNDTHNRYTHLIATLTKRSLKYFTCSNQPCFNGEKCNRGKLSSFLITTQYNNYLSSCACLYICIWREQILLKWPLKLQLKFLAWFFFFRAAAFSCFLSKASFFNFFYSSSLHKFSSLVKTHCDAFCGIVGGGSFGIATLSSAIFTSEFCLKLDW